MSMAVSGKSQLWRPGIRIVTWDLVLGLGSLCYLAVGSLRAQRRHQEIEIFGWISRFLFFSFLVSDFSFYFLHSPAMAVLASEGEYQWPSNNLHIEFPEEWNGQHL